MILKYYDLFCDTRLQMSLLDFIRVYQTAYLSCHLDVWNSTPKPWFLDFFFHWTIFFISVNGSSPTASHLTSCSLCLEHYSLPPCNYMTHSSFPRPLFKYHPFREALLGHSIWCSTPCHPSLLFSIPLTYSIFPRETDITTYLFFHLIIVCHSN